MSDFRNLIATIATIIVAVQQIILVSRGESLKDTQVEASGCSYQLEEIISAYKQLERSL